MKTPADISTFPFFSFPLFLLDACRVFGGLSVLIFGLLGWRCDLLLLVISSC